MTTVSNVAVALVALLHLYFLILEMFLWDKPLGLRTFGLTPEFAQASKALAANQGLYNGFLVAGLVWGLGLGQSGNPIKIFFLGCVVVAGRLRRGDREPQDPLGPGAARRDSARAGPGVLRSIQPSNRRRKE